MTLQRIIDELTYFRRNMYYKAEGFLTTHNCTAFLFFPHSFRSKEKYIGELMDFLLDLEIRRSGLFKSVFRKISRTFFSSDS